ncbi:prolyl oligopeptidase family serine peptidase [Spirosoma oryzicola]|uniref:prolyl oligopeptidase family serine peptidase n=1 Tax=Spirosoma oryzicola TaxID=2898794 RepID=UPI001E5015C8|nr:prolyl oligopeptidase family serine peptidase [Spirosoma oryzicola]UHG93063.1 prolyl oligopeptidase family serine peptidase [Spirosoma oryzicola]
MKRHIYLFLLTALVTSTAVAQQSLPTASLPATPKRPVTDVYFGKTVVDNYRWLEDINSPDVKDWFKAQGAYTNAVLDKIPGRDKLIETFVEYDKLVSVRYGEIKKRGNLYFYRKTLPAEKVGKIYVRQGKTGTEKLLFDPTAVDKTKTYSVTNFAPSSDGKQVVIGLQEGGAELSTVRTMDVATQTFRPESITAVQGGEVNWLADNSGFFYTPQNSNDPKDPKGNLDTKARMHRLGTDPKTDPDLFSRAKNPDMGIRPDQYPITLMSGDNTQLYGELASVDRRVDAWVADPADLAKPAIAWKRLAAPSDSVRSYVKIGDQLFLHSIKGAPNGKVLVTDARNPQPSSATVLLPEGKQNISRVVPSKDFLFVILSDGINETVRQYDARNKQWADVPVKMTGTVYVEPYDAPRSNEIIVYVTSWNNPGMMYDYNPANQQLIVSPFHVPMNYPGVADLIVEELEIPSHDGTRVPLSLVYKKGLKRDGNTICFMTGYGAYGSSATPYFSRRNLALLNRGVILAETHPRGGSEKGQAWYQAGFKTTKPNTWKDFIASGEYLIKNGYTSASKLIGEGTSAGGILIGRAITERPDLFAAAISNVSCSNALRMENSPNGPVNAPEFGTVKDSVECMALYEMDAFQHVKDGTKYPAVLCIGGMNDPRVIAWQPGKLAAALQTASTSGKPVLMQVNYDNGHFTEDKAVTFRNFANMYAFALWQAGHPDFQPRAVVKK